MSNDVVNYYENYQEEDRITTNNARRIEFLTTIHKFDELLNGNLEILDCAAGTGAYAFYLANKGHSLTATDITVYCKIKVPKVAEQKWTLLQVHFGHNCKALYHDSMERCCA